MTATITSGQLRFGQVGPYIVGTPGDVLTFQADGRTLMGAAVAAGIIGLSTLLWVDSGAAAGGDGTIAAPFNNMGDAVAAAGPGWTLAVVPGDYSGEAPLAPATALVILGLTSTRAGNGVALPVYEPTNDNHSISNCSLTYAGTSGAVTITLENCSTTFAASTDTAFVDGGAVSGEIGLMTTSGARVNCGPLTLTAVGASNVLTNCNCAADVLATGPGVIEFRNCRVGGSAVEGSDLVFRNCEFEAAVAIDCVELSWDSDSSRSAANAGALLSGNLTAVHDLSERNPIYGEGETGDLTIAAGVTGLAEEQQFANLTINGTGRLETGRVILRVRDFLDLSAAPALAINSRTGRNGGNAAAAVGGTAGVGENGWLPGTGGIIAGTAGATATNGAGTTPGAATGVRYCMGGASGGQQGGGAGVAAGGASSTGNVASNNRVGVPSPTGIGSSFAGPVANPGSAVADVSLWGSQPGRGGASGGGNGGAVAGGGGGGGAAGAANVIIFARIVKVSGATPANCISAAGFNGGNGGNGSADALATGGGAGGGASGGGGVLIVYDWLVGSGASAAAIDARGGTGGTGGNGNGSGAAAGGNGGDGGAGGQIIVQALKAGTRVRTVGAAGTAGSAAVGNVGGAGGAGGACTATF